MYCFYINTNKLYHADAIQQMVRCAAAGVSVEDIEKELDMRSLKLKRRPGESIKTPLLCRKLQ